MSEHPYQYIVLHYSCANRPGVAAVQAAHAASEAIQSLPVPPDTHVCVLVANSQDVIRDAAVRLEFAGLRIAKVIEPDPPYNGAITAIGVEITDRERVQPILANLKPLR